MKPEFLIVEMKNGMGYKLPLNESHNSNITFYHNRIEFEEYWAEGYKPYNLPQIYYYEDIEEFYWR